MSAQAWVVLLLVLDLLLLGLLLIAVFGNEDLAKRNTDLILENWRLRRRVGWLQRVAGVDASVEPEPELGER